MVDKTIKLTKETKDLLDVYKIHPRQSYDEVIRMLIKIYKESREWKLKKH